MSAWNLNQKLNKEKKKISNKFAYYAMEKVYVNICDFSRLYPIWRPLKVRFLQSTI